MTVTSKKYWAVLLLVLGCLFAPCPTNATAIYSYSAPFTELHGDYTPNNYLRGYFQTDAPLAPGDWASIYGFNPNEVFPPFVFTNTFTGETVPFTWYFTDGLSTLAWYDTHLDLPFKFVVDDFGFFHVTAHIGMVGSPMCHLLIACGMNISAEGFDSAYYYADTSRGGIRFAQVTNDQSPIGGWTLILVPEPSALPLALAALAAIIAIGIVRRHQQR
jgi:hypothetical protein